MSAKGQEIYFHRNGVVNGGFAALAVGNEVRFVAHYSESAEGPQASTVAPLASAIFRQTRRCVPDPNNPGVTAW
jgi:cold shock CspA family protein